MNFSVPAALRAWRREVADFAAARAAPLWDAAAPVDTGLLDALATLGFAEGLVGAGRWLRYALGSLEIAAAHPEAYLAIAAGRVEAPAVLAALGVEEDLPGTIVAMAAGPAPTPLRPPTLALEGEAVRGEVTALAVRGEPRTALVLVGAAARTPSAVAVDLRGPGVRWVGRGAAGPAPWEWRDLAAEGAPVARRLGRAGGGAAAFAAHLFERWLRAGILGYGLADRLVGLSAAEAPDAEAAGVRAMAEAARWQTLAAAWARDSGEESEVRAAAAMELALDALAAAEALAAERIRGGDPGAVAALGRLRALADLAPGSAAVRAFGTALLRRAARER